MAEEMSLKELIKGMKPNLHKGEYVFCSLKNVNILSREDTICEFKEEEGVTVVLAKLKADALRLEYTFVASWITLTIHSSLNAVGLTASISTELTKHNISCNVIAGYFHDHIFVDSKDAKKVLEALDNMSKNI